MMHVKNIYGTTPNKLSKVMYSNHSTLESDQRKFGKCINLALAKGSSELREERFFVLL